MGFSVGVPKEQKPGEQRVSLTPKGTKYLSERGIDVYIEKNAGLLSGFSNLEYEKAGSILVSDAKTLWNKAQLVKKVKEPVEKEFSFFTPQHIIFSYLHLASPSAKPLILALKKSKATAIAYETVQKGKEMPLLSPMSEVAGALAAYYGAIFQNHIKIEDAQIKGIPEVRVAMVRAASYYPAVPDIKYRGKVLILGGGHVGKNAAEMIAQMGGEVWVSEVSVERRRQLNSEMVSVNVINPSNLEQYHKCLSEADIIIGAVHTIGKRAPLVIDQDLLKKISHQKTKIILDISIDQGGNIAESEPRDYERPLYLDSFGNLRFSVTNIPSFCGRGASEALEVASLEYTNQLARGLNRALQIFPELKSGVNVLKGEMVISY